MPVRRTLPTLLAAVGLGAVLTGCGTFAHSYAPTGVDGLTIPTASPGADDFVSAVDNPWLALRAGAPRVYDVSAPGLTGATRTLAVLPGQVEVAGVPTTAVRDTLAGRRGDAPVAEVSTDYYAQDDRGNVWWFGHEGRTGAWRAGEGGARAGLAMAAEPRRADGYRTAYLPGVEEDVATVVQVDHDDLEVDVTSALAPGGVVRETYRRGTGLVTRIDAVAGEFDQLRR